MVISVVIPLYNKAASIERAVRSVLSQTYRDFEIIVIDDGSTDDGSAIVKRIEDKRIRVIQQPNGGVSAARNRGIAEARGKYVALLDADDEWKPDYLAIQMMLAEKYPECSVYATGYEMRKSTGEKVETIIRGLPFDGPDGELSNYFEVASESHPPICSISVMAQKNAFESIGGFPGGIRSGEDLLTWARLASRFKIAYTREIQAVFNIEGYDVRERPKRVPAENDIVHQELVKIKEVFNPYSIDRYISHWHKMRSSIYMRLGMRWKSIRESLIGLRYRPLNYKLAVFIVLNLLPKRLQPF